MMLPRHFQHPGIRPAGNQPVRIHPVPCRYQDVDFVRMREERPNRLRVARQVKKSLWLLRPSDRCKENVSQCESNNRDCAFHDAGSLSSPGDRTQRIDAPPLAWTARLFTQACVGTSINAVFVHQQAAAQSMPCLSTNRLQLNLNATSSPAAKLFPRC